MDVILFAENVVRNISRNTMKLIRIKLKKMKKKYYEQNKEVIKMQSKEWQKNNPEKAKLNKKRYLEAHKDKN
jgi:hypothetical protein